jgi:hypothetical protein
MFCVRCVGDHYKFTPMNDIHSALDMARSESLYGNWTLVEIWDLEVRNLFVSFNAKEMRDATRQQREACEVQEFPRVWPGL